MRALIKMFHHSLILPLKLKDNKVVLVLIVMMVVIKVEKESQLKEMVVIVQKIHIVKDKVELKLFLNHFQCIHIKDQEALTVLVLMR